ncbi:MAG: family mycofactocin-dependent oxidoreductase [Microbacteriaceae bacterium]|jgi:NAD(P)-dependent dehydrogenase (short-subunit alcohol dehydrogenase family)|nr:family mycofactocin-dependent oxidoreductase [Microbacteriaceae bacterium]
MSRESAVDESFASRVAFITGAGRGQGRSHALRLAELGADVALVDLGSVGSVSSPTYATATRDELNSVADEVRGLGRRALVVEADVRSAEQMVDAAASAVRELGQIDYVVANAGITDGFAPTWELAPENWQTMIDINLTGVFHTVRAAIPHLLVEPAGRGLVLIGSGVAIKAVPNLSHYVAAKYGVRGLAAALAAELGPYGIRCNSVHPAGINTEMTTAMVELNGIPREELLERFRSGQLLQMNVEISDITAAVVWLLSDEARFVTGVELTVDAGESKK